MQLQRMCCLEGTHFDGVPTATLQPSTLVGCVVHTVCVAIYDHYNLFKRRMALLQT